MAITLTQNTYRLWCRIGPTYGSGTLYPADVVAQVAWLAAQSILQEKP